MQCRCDVLVASDADTGLSSSHQQPLKVLVVGHHHPIFVI